MNFFFQETQDQTQDEDCLDEQEALQDKVEEHEIVPNLVPEKQDMTPRHTDKNFTFPTRASAKRHRSISPDEANINKHLKQASDALKTFAAKSQSQTLHDAPALYGNLLATKLRQMKPRTQIILQNKIDNLVFEAQLSELDDVGAPVGRSVTCNFISQNTPAQYNSSSNSQFSYSSNYVPSPAPSPASQNNDNLNINSQCVETTVCAPSPPLSHILQQNDNVDINSQPNDQLLRTYYSNAHTLL